MPRLEVHRHDILIALVLIERGRVVVQHVETAERGDGVGDHRRDRVGIGDVDDLRARRPARGDDGGNDLVGRAHAEIGNRHRGALGRKQHRRRPADAGTAARDDRDLAVEPAHRSPCERRNRCTASACSRRQVASTDSNPSPAGRRVTAANTGARRSSWRSISASDGRPARSSSASFTSSSLRTSRTWSTGSSSQRRSAARPVASPARSCVADRAPRPRRRTPRRTRPRAASRASGRRADARPSRSARSRRRAPARARPATRASAAPRRHPARPNRRATARAAASARDRTVS